MNFIRRCLVAVIFLLSAASCFASALSIQVVQHSKGESKIFETTRVIENSLLDFFFENGCIVSNSPIAVSQFDDNEDESIFYKGSDDAYYGAVRYFVTVYVDLDLEESRNPDAVSLSNISKISWKTLDVRTNVEIDHGSGKVKANAPSKKTEDAEKRVSDFASEVAARIFREIKAR